MSTDVNAERIRVALADDQRLLREVLRLIAQGHTNAEIAAELFVSEATVKTHVHHLLTKLGARDRAHAIVLARQRGLS